MIREGIYYALGFSLAALLVGWLIAPVWAVAPLVFAVFWLWFYRDPERTIPAGPGAIVSPADGKVTDVAVVDAGGAPRLRISIFLSPLDVHVNRSPIAGKITHVEYRRGKFGNAIGAASADENEQNIVTLAGEGRTIVMKQIAGLLARRIVFWKRVGDEVRRGERVGMIKLGSRTDVLLDVSVAATVKVGDRVRGGATVIAQAPGTEVQP